MGMIENPRAVPGDNRPPAYDPEVFAALDSRVVEFSATAGDWLRRGEVEDEEAAAALSDFITGTRGLRKEVDAARIAQKRPHDEAADAVQAAFKPLLAALDETLNQVGAMATKWLDAQKAKAEAERRRREEEARRAAEEAERLRAQAASRHDVIGEASAKEAAKAAEKAAKEAARPVKVGMASASGGGRTVALRSHVVAEIVDPLRAVMHYRQHPDVLEVVRRLAAADARAAKGADIEIPGIRITREERAA